jgi:membrane peptidoglycan carboxypeptidase
MSRPSSSPRPRKTKNQFVTSSGRSIKVNRNLSEKVGNWRDTRLRHKAARLAGMPKTRIKRILFRCKPSNLYHYWFSREGAIMALKLVGLGLISIFIVIVGAFAYFRKDLPSINNIYGQNLGGSISYYDSTGKTLLWQDYDAVKRVPVAGNQISPYVKEATVAIEDKNFYHEGAFDVGAILRSAYHDIFHSSSGVEGASTITEQLVKLNEGGIGNRSLKLKIEEVILATELERQYSKDQILTAYLDIAPYSGVDYGVQAAAEDYFGETASQLTLAQSTMLAAIPQSPDYYSPYSPDFVQSALTARQQYILQLMVGQKTITEAQAKAAEAVNVLAQIKPQQSKYSNIIAPYFVLAAKQQLENQFGASTVQHGGWKVVTTLNTTLQNYAEEDVANNASNVAAVGGDEEAMVAEDVKTGQVVAQVGGENFNNPVDGQINYANTNISPGSSMKPFLYAALIQNNDNVGAGSVFYDSQSPLPGYPCTDKTEPTATSNGGNCLWDDNFIYPGAETIRYALAGSRNVPAVKAAYEIIPGDKSPGYTASIDKWISEANSAIGVSKAYACYENGVNIETATTAQQTQCYGSAALGSGDIAIDQEVNGDVTLARLGAEIPQTYILKITDASNKSIYQWQQPKSTQVYKPDTAYIIDSILDDPRATYLQPYQKFQNYDGWDIAVKTGTENQEYNGVMTAWSTQYAVIGFAGYHTLDHPLEDGHFEDITEPITRTWMEQALTNLHTKPVNWTAPSDVKTLPSYIQTVSTGYGAEVPGPSTDLYPSWYVQPSDSKKSYTVDIVSNDLATSCTPPLARKTISSGGSANIFSVDIFETGGSSAASASSYDTTANDTVHLCSDQPPTVSLTSASTPPSCSGVTCTIDVNVTQGTHPLASSAYPLQLNALVDGKSIACSLNSPINNSSPPSSLTDAACSFNYS